MKRILAIFAAIGAASIISLLSFGNSAEASRGVSSCQGKTASSVIECCQEIVAQNGTPMWMRGDSLSCHEVVKCEWKYCHVQVLYLEKESDGRNNRSRRK
jgi:hypothetical protein